MQKSIKNGDFSPRPDEKEGRVSPGRLMMQLKSSKRLIEVKRSDTSIDDLPTLPAGGFDENYEMTDNSYSGSDACTTQIFGRKKKLKRHYTSETNLHQRNVGLCNQILRTVTREERIKATF